MSRDTKLSYRFKAFQIEGEDGTFEWGVQFVDIPDVVGGGDTLEEAYSEALSNLDVYISYLKDNGKDIPLPTKEPEYDGYSGKLVLRLSKGNHKKIAELADIENISINSLLNEMVTEGIQKRICEKSVSQLIMDTEKEYLVKNNLSYKLVKN